MEPIKFERYIDVINEPPPERDHKVELVEDALVFSRRHQDRWDEIYWIELEDCRTPKQILEWIRQLSEKGWVDTWLLRDFCNLLLMRIEK